MALRVRDRYGNNANEPSIDYPTGSVKNISAPEATDGTPLEKDWANEFLGTRDAILKAAGIVADGSVETAENSQVLEALNTLYKALSTEDLPGIIQIANAAEAKALTDNTKAITPKNLGDAMNAHVLGIGQTWQDVTASRAPNTSYTNTTGRAITIAISASDEGLGDARFYVEGIPVGRVNIHNVTGAVTSDYSVGAQIYADVPAGDSYKLEFTQGRSQSLLFWSELR